jgi:hypothetical protein
VSNIEHLFELRFCHNSLGVYRSRPGAILHGSNQSTLEEA